MIPTPTLPRYREIEQALRERIATLKPGDPLPSDADLCREFGVSRMTARNADAAARRGGAGHARARARQLRRGAASRTAGRTA